MGFVCVSLVWSSLLATWLGLVGVALLERLLCLHDGLFYGVVVLMVGCFY